MDTETVPVMRDDPDVNGAANGSVSLRPAEPRTYVEIAEKLITKSIDVLARGELNQALVAAEKAAVLTRQAGCPPAQRARALCQLGAAQYKLAQLGEAVANFSGALALVEDDAQSPHLVAEILEWRSRYFRRQRDFAAAALDCERALHAAKAAGDPHQLAHVFFQSSLVAERSGDPDKARAFGVEALALYRQVGDTLNAGRTMNNLGGLFFLLGDRSRARELLAEAESLLFESGNQAEAGQALSSLAQVELRSDEPENALADSERALELLGDRDDLLDERGCALLVRGQALMELTRHDEASEALLQAEALFARFGSVGHQSAAWLALGDLALRCGDHLGAVPYFRRAAAALQDIHF